MPFGLFVKYPWNYPIAYNENNITNKYVKTYAQKNSDKMILKIWIKATKEK